MIKKEMLKRIFIAGASSALKYKEIKPSASESEVMSQVTKDMKKMIEDIEEDM